jgi:hypothetical protein
LPGSTAAAKRRFASVYSWPQYTRVSPGSAASAESERHISSAVPSNRRPHPAANNVSPQNSAGAPHARRADERDVARRVARDVEHVELEIEAGNREAIALRDRARARGIASRAGPITGHRAIAHEIDDAAGMVPVVVRDEDRRQRNALGRRATRARAPRRPDRRRPRGRPRGSPTRSCR